MAHLVDTMAYVGKTPWHGLGNKLENGLSLEQWREAAGMDWVIKDTAVRYPTPDGPRKMDDRVVLYRSDTNDALSVVSTKYQVVQPAEILEFFRDVTEAGHMQLDTAGVLDKGKKLWALARMDYDISFGEDKLNNYLLLATACDGSMSTRAYYTSIRVVCNNTLQWSLQGAKNNGVSIPHSAAFNASAVQHDLGIDKIGDSVRAFGTEVEALINTDMSPTAQRDYFSAVITRTDLGANRPDLTKYEAGMLTTLEALAANSPGAQLETAQGTAWGALNAVTHFTDFFQRASNDNNRFRASQFGNGAAMKSDAKNKALLVAA